MLPTVEHDAAGSGLILVVREECLDADAINREVGATCVPTSIKAEEAAVKEEKGGNKPARSYTVTLLPDPTKTLGDVLPAIKLPAKRK